MPTDPKLQWTYVATWESRSGNKYDVWTRDNLFQVTSASTPPKMPEGEGGYFSFQALAELKGLVAAKVEDQFAATTTTTTTKTKPVVRIVNNQGARQYAGFELVDITTTLPKTFAVAMPQQYAERAARCMNAYDDLLDLVEQLSGRLSPRGFSSPKGFSHNDPLFLRVRSTLQRLKDANDYLE